jgi:hypothetical protein
LKRPAIQFYPGDWKINGNLRRCSWGARGVWIEIMGMFHDSDEYGVLRWPLKEIAQSLGAPKALLTELVEKTVLKGIDKGSCTEFVFRAKHAGKLGDPVVLIPEQAGPIWFSSRMVTDEYKRKAAGANTRFGSPSQREGDAPSHGDGDNQGGHLADGMGYGSSTTTSSSLKPKPISVDTPHVNLSPGDVSKILRAGGADSQPGQPHVIALAEQGVPRETIEAACLEAREIRKREDSSDRITSRFIVSIIERWANQASNLNVKGAAAPKENIHAKRERTLDGLLDRRPDDSDEHRTIDVPSRIV